MVALGRPGVFVPVGGATVCVGVAVRGTVGSVGVTVNVAVGVGVFVGSGVLVAVAVAVFVGVGVAVLVGVGVAVLVGVGVGVSVGVGVFVGVGVDVSVGVGVLVGVFVGVGVSVATPTVNVTVREVWPPPGSVARRRTVCVPTTRLFRVNDVPVPIASPGWMFEVQSIAVPLSAPVSGSIAVPEN